MRLLAVVLSFAITTSSFAQQPSQGFPQDQAATSGPASVPSQAQTVTVPAGTRIPVTLTNTISTSSTKAGDSIRVVTAFPVTVETQLAIPAGAYVEGTIDKLSKRKSANRDVLHMHFSRIVFANGYQVTLEDATAIARVVDEKETSNLSASLPRQNIPGAMSFQQPSQLPQPPPLPHHGVPAALIGVAVGSAAFVIVGVLVLATIEDKTLSLTLAPSLIFCCRNRSLWKLPNSQPARRQMVSEKRSSRRF